METMKAARRWATTWERAWMAQDVDAIVALYAPGATYRSSPFREPEDGGARGYVGRTFAEESNVVCRFGPPMVDGARATVEWWASFTEFESELTLAGATVLTFDAEGSVVDHVDYWVHTEGRRSPFPGWAGG
jgi:hypothetical protein